MWHGIYHAHGFSNVTWDFRCSMGFPMWHGISNVGSLSTPQTMGEASNKKTDLAYLINKVVHNQQKVVDKT